MFTLLSSPAFENLKTWNSNTNCVISVIQLLSHVDHVISTCLNCCVQYRIFSLVIWQVVEIPHVSVHWLNECVRKGEMMECTTCHAVIARAQQTSHMKTSRCTGQRFFTLYLFSIHVIVPYIFSSPEGVHEVPTVSHQCSSNWWGINSPSSSMLPVFHYNYYTVCPTSTMHSWCTVTDFFLM